MCKKTVLWLIIDLTGLYIAYELILYLHYVASHLNSMQCFAVFCVLVLVVSIFLYSIDLHYVIV